jgi:ribokinase
MLVVFGSLNLDYVTFVARAPGPGETISGMGFAMHPGGKGANQAYAAARLGAAVRLVGRVGRDQPGEILLAHLREGGVDLTGVAGIDGVTTGVAVILVEASGQNRIVVVPGANGTWTGREVEAAAGAFAEARLVLIQLETPIEAVAAAMGQARAAGASVVLDPSPAQPLGPDLLAGVDYLTPNEAELALLCGVEPPRSGLSRPEAATLARTLIARGARRVIAKLGAAGALLVEGSDEQWWPALPVRAVDTTAAGDAFNGALAVALGDGAEIGDAGRFACAAAACSVTRAGAQGSMPTRAEVFAALREWR